MIRIRLLGVLALCLIFAVATDAAWGRAKTGVLTKEKRDGQKYEIFQDTVYGYTLTTPSDWDFDSQKEKGKDERNPFRLKIKCKDKQIPDQLWESPSAVVNAHINWFVFEGLEMTPQEVRDSLFSDDYKADWRKPIYKNCDLLLEAQYLNEGDVRWGPWRGAFQSLDYEYTAQIPTGGGLFGSISEKRLAEIYVFPFKEQILILYLVSERQYLPDNREVVKELLHQIEPIPDFTPLTPGEG